MKNHTDIGFPSFTVPATGQSPDLVPPTARSVVLFGTLDGAPVLSMERFAETLVRLLPTYGWNARLVRGAMAKVPRIHRLADYVARELTPHFLYPRRARSEKADVYHIIADAFSYIIGAIPADRTVVTCHDLAPWQVPEIYSHRFGRTFGLPLWERGVRRMTRAAHIACDSEFTRQEVHTRLGVPLPKMSVVYLGVSEAFRPYPPDKRAAVRASLGLPPEACLVLHVGNAMVSKNPEGAIRTSAQLRQKGLPAWFVKVGPVSPEQQDLIIELGLGDFYRKLQAPDDSALCDVYNACDVLVFPSLNEGFGWPPLEAMRAGLPVVISNTPALTETTGGLAPAFDPYDYIRMAEAAQEMWELRGDRDLIAIPGCRRAETFTWDRTVSQMAAIYERVLG